MATVTITDLRENIETDLPDAALTRLLAEAVLDVESRFGDDSAQTVVLDGGGRYLRLLRPAASVSAIVEKALDRSVLATLDATDYEVRHGGRLIERLEGGNNSRGEGWADIVSVTYTPHAEEAIRNGVLIDLVKAAISYEGLIKNQVVGDYDSEGDLAPDTYTRERENILRRLSNHRGFRFL